MSRREDKQVGSEGREGVGRGMGWGRGRGDWTPRSRGGHRQLNGQSKFDFSCGVRAGKMAEAGRAGKQEREIVRENCSEDSKLLSDEEFVDDRMERLGRYLSDNLNFEHDTEDEDDARFMLDGCDDMPPLEGGDDMLVPETGLTYPAKPAAVPATVKLEEHCLWGGDQCNKERVYNVQVEKKAGVVLLSEEDEDFDQFEDLCEQFDDGPGQFNDRVNQFGGGVMPSAISDCLLPQEVGCVAGCDSVKDEMWEGGGEDSGDDGWISDPGETENLFRLNSGMTTSLLICTLLSGHSRSPRGTSHPTTSLCHV